MSTDVGQCDLITDVDLQVVMMWKPDYEVDYALRRERLRNDMDMTFRSCIVPPMENKEEERAVLTKMNREGMQSHFWPKVKTEKEKEMEKGPRPTWMDEEEEVAKSMARRRAEKDEEEAMESIRRTVTQVKLED
jgi:hypothetical protein